VSSRVSTGGAYRGIEDSFVEVDGARVHFQRAGSGRPLLLIHGLVGSAQNWRLNIGHLADIATVYAIDMLNMGESDRVPGLDAGLEAIADRIGRWMQVVGIDEADIAGHSHGGAVAMMLAARHPERVGRLVLFAPANPFCDLGKQLIAFYNSRVGQFAARFAPSLPVSLKMFALGRMYGDSSRVTLESLDGYTAGLTRPGTVAHVLQVVRRWYEDMGILRTALTGLGHRRALLIWGDHDRAVGLASARQLQKLLPKSQLHVIPGVGHLAFEEMPDVCNRIVREWLSAPEPVGQPAHAFKKRYAKKNLKQLKAC
jgi:4,5:9,10-diseco-3-hydroxy-5,9,17-trioxoandrosta-1(10),2-diene-4-oate hydrolase